MVALYVDGVTYDPYLVTDDWPIHPSQIDVQLTVGACWQGDAVRSNKRYSVIEPNCLETGRVQLEEKFGHTVKVKVIFWALRNLLLPHIVTPE